MIAVNAADTTGVLKSARNAAFRRTHRLHESEGGFTLVELLVTILILGLVMGATISILTTTQRAVPGDIEASHTIEDAQVGLNRMTRELRQGTNVTIYDSGTADTTAPIDGDQITADFGTTRVLYMCDVALVNAAPGETLRRCVRKAGTVSTPPTFNTVGKTEQLFNAVRNSELGVNVFTAPSTKYFQIAIKTKSTGSVKVTTANPHTVTLSDAFYARNM